MTALSILLRPMAWFRRPAQTDYEEVLAGLTADIDSVQTNLVQIQSRKRRATLILPFWASVLWLVWTALAWWLGQLGAGAGDNIMLVWGPIIGAPILIFFTRRIVRWWYKRVQALEEDHLKELQRQRRAKIEEIKRATRYDHLRMLLDKYDDDKNPAAAAPGASGAPKQPGAGPGPQTPRRGGPGVPQNPSAPASASPVPPAGAPRMGAAGPAHIQPIQPLPSGMRGQQPPQPAPGFPARGALPPAVAPPVQVRRTWLDRMADAVLGADPSSAALGPEQKYALICAQCKRHNGLAAREEFDEVQYICPACGTFNTRRPSSVPVSSPWATPSRPTGQGRASPAPPQGERLHPGTQTQAQGKTLSARTVGDEEQDEDDVGNDSAPPAAPLGASSSDDEDDDEEQEGGATEEYTILEGRKKSAAAAAASAGLSRRTASRPSGDEIDVDEDL